MANKTPLYDLHVSLGGRIVEFAGYELPIQYETGIIAEHNAVRNNCGLFDVSHMGELFVEGANAEEAVNYLVSNDISGMKDYSCRYTLMLNEKGGVVDDFIVYRFSAVKYMLVANASNKDKDFAWVKNHLIEGATVTDNSALYGQIALQGPKAEVAFAKLTNAFPTEYYTFCDNVEVAGAKCLVSRTGYTGEDGFEIYVPVNQTAAVYEAVLNAAKEYGCLPCGLGCRDTLRFEACLPLYGHELAEDYLATELGLGFFIKMDKADFVGKQALLTTPACFKKKGIRLIDRGIAREHFDVYDEQDNKIGFVTTGTMSPTLNAAIALTRINKSYDAPYCYVDCRGRKLKAEFVKTPFYRRSK